MQPFCMANQGLDLAVNPQWIKHLQVTLSRAQIPRLVNATLQWQVSDWGSWLRHHPSRHSHTAVPVASEVQPKVPSKQLICVMQEREERRSAKAGQGDSAGAVLDWLYTTRADVAPRLSLLRKCPHSILLKTPINAHTTSCSVICGWTTT